MGVASWQVWDPTDHTGHLCWQTGGRLHPEGKMGATHLEHVAHVGTQGPRQSPLSLQAGKGGHTRRAPTQGRSHARGPPDGRRAGVGTPIARPLELL